MKYTVIIYTRTIDLPKEKSRKINIKVEKPVSDKLLKETSPGIQVDVINLPSTGAPTTLVTRIQALSFNELPTRYTQSDDMFPSSKVWQDGRKLMGGNNCILLEEGSSYRRSYIQEALLYIELAGRRLAAVKKKKGLPIAENCLTTFKDGVFKRRKGKL